MLFSAYAEVFRRVLRRHAMTEAFLCLRRGVSLTTCESPTTMGFSLPTQRCFQQRSWLPQPQPLFSAYAEVFPSKFNPTKSLSAFSLPTQRCFHQHASWRRKENLFSAYAEVFPAYSDRPGSPSSFSLPTQRCFRRPGGYG